MAVVAGTLRALESRNPLGKVAVINSRWIRDDARIGNETIGIREAAGGWHEAHVILKFIPFIDHARAQAAAGWSALFAEEGRGKLILTPCLDVRDKYPVVRQH